MPQNDDSKIQTKVNGSHVHPLGPTTSDIANQTTLTGAEPATVVNTTLATETTVGSLQVPSEDSMSTFEVAESLSGLLYLILTLTLSVYYLGMVSPSMANDLWWSDFNASGVQSYLIDVYNVQLNVLGNQTKSIDLMSRNYGLGKDYSQASTRIELSPVYPRLLYVAAANDLAAFVAALRQIPGPHWVLSQYCWVDLNRTWEVAHSVERQKRCYQRYADNGAVYYEPIVRLVDWNKWLKGYYGGAFNTTIGRAMRKTPEGQAWLSTTPYSFQSIETEVAYWRKMGILRYTFQYTNSYSNGISETLGVQNALGVTQYVTTKRIPYQSRSEGWTTLWMYFGPFNDLPYGDALGYSYLLNDPDNQRFSAPCNYSDFVANPATYSCDPCDLQWNPDAANCNMNYEMFLGLPDTPTFRLVHGNIGPLNSIDLYIVQPPASVISVFSAFQESVSQHILTNYEFAASMVAIPTLSSDPIPPSWLQPSLMYMGGDPTCLFREPTSFIQGSFSYDVSCTSEESHSIVLTPYNTLFALWATSQTNISKVCSASLKFKQACNAVLSSAFKATMLLIQAYPGGRSSFLPLILAAYKDVATLGISTIQFAINTTDMSNVYLRQQVLGGNSADQWDVFGWMFLYEWAQGYREVVSFEGDANVIPIISDKNEPIIDEAQSLDIPVSACQYLWAVVIVVTTVQLFVGTMITFYYLLLRGRIIGRNLFQFNRVVGTVWLNRPLLFVRGLTAVILLSSSPLKFQTQSGYAYLNMTLRTLFESMLVAGEATWISYVTYDFLLVFFLKRHRYVAPLTSCVTWLCLLVIDTNWPYKITTTLNRKCSIDIVSNKFACTVGWIEIGSLSRATMFVLVLVACTIVPVLVINVWSFLRKRKSENSSSHLLLSSSALGFLHNMSQTNGRWILDRASCIMCGVVTFDKTIIDLKLWLLIDDKSASTSQVKWGMKFFENIALDKKNDSIQPHESTAVPVEPPIKWRHRLLTLTGLLYVISTIFGSVTFLTLTATNMANDFWWANYNATREHVYVSRLLNSLLTLRPHVGGIKLTDSKFMDEANYTITLSTGVGTTMRQLYASQVLSTDAMDLSTVIHGLRVMDACLAPWISSQYCWLDFGKKWEMANTATRQNRCANMYSTNAAVYLEAVLRNVRWSELTTCWGTSLNVALGTPLSKLPNGASWWTSVQSIKTSELEELKYWQSFNLEKYETDWQNYKSIGIIERFGMQNAFGSVYPMTLKYTNGSLNLKSQTSMKMYWGFASDLWAVSSPSISMYGASLIRQDLMFAFKNRSIESILVENGTLSGPELVSGGAYSTFRAMIGPFGSVDLKRVPAPASLMAFWKNFKDTVAELCVQSAGFAKSYLALSVFNPMQNYLPPSWQESDIQNVIGGNLLCNEVPEVDTSLGIYLLTDGKSACGSQIDESIKLSTSARLFATIGSNLVRRNLTIQDTDAICSTFKGISLSSCTKTLLHSSVDLLLSESFVSSTLLAQLRSMADIAQKDIQALSIEVNQYGKTVNDTTVLLRHQIFDAAYPSFHYIAWLMAVDWATNIREVISFQGDVDSANVITSVSYDTDTSVNSQDIPVNVAYYIRYVCLYVTGIIICVAALASLYILVNKGHIEGLNLFEINRVVGIVWIGRVFLFIRGVAAICLLSTQVLSLENIHDCWHLVDATRHSNESSGDRGLRIFKTILAAGEVSWLGYVLNDIFSIFTAQYTTSYVIKCTTVVWGVAAILSLVAPPTHDATLDRQCTFAHVDFQLVCNSGTIAIGSFDRFVSLVGLCIGSIVVCYLYERLRHPSLQPPQHSSLFLSASAKYMFQRDRWTHEQVYCIDQASAAINGILSVKIGNIFYIFDLKIWRLFAIEVSKEKRERLERDGKRHLLSAIPLPN
ncbi:hypothetical protein AC1031_014075 [Aphanomyces cochlioides]|nr:hypothetical protein AC1031_014075 [Aphanomyces cochlioides]